MAFFSYRIIIGYISFSFIWIFIIDIVIPGKIKKKGYLSKFVYGVNFIIYISKGLLENKVETLAIYISLLCQCIWRDILGRWDYSKD